MNFSIDAILITLLVVAAALTGMYFYSHNAGYDEGKTDETAIFLAYQADQEKSVQAYKDQVSAMANQLDQANLKNEALAQQLDTANNQELHNATSKSFYDLVIPADSVRAYNQRIQATRPANTK